MSKKPAVYTLGHSSRSFDEFLRILKRFEIAALADVRRFPGSKFDHFKKVHLEKALPENGIEYVWFEELGGYRRKVLENSPNTAIESEGFRNYADYMLTEEFRHAAEMLAEMAKERRVAVMCAEKLYWRCHRMLLSDYLHAVLGFEVLHIIDASSVRRHRLSKHARVTEEGLVYDVM
ncbi:DUF488 family protein [Geoglobus acetivorans]|uniref:DUF488 domain-containing protein n=1 Tax=Geoglobus acetivorans TaxID=565033 RepID=A0ABZ3H3D3_GEOAI|nr:DUF488 domain-containing protein [Geoglobus acetivorans]